jgi:hypothetical protein
MILPILVLSVALLFHLLYFALGANMPGLLVPGGILLVYGLWMLAPAINGRFLLFFELWPLALIGPALGIFELYVFSRGQHGSMKAVFILTVIGGIFLLREFMDMSIWLLVGVFLVVVGFFIILNSLGNRRRVKEDKHPVHPGTPRPDSGPIVRTEPVVEVRDTSSEPISEQDEEVSAEQPSGSAEEEAKQEE